MNDLSPLSLHLETTEVARWKAERENATARFEIAGIKRRRVELIMQHDPANYLGIDRDRLRLALDYVVIHGDLLRLRREFEELTKREEGKA